MAVPNTFANATTSIPLIQLDQNFNTGITLGNTTVYLGNTTTSLGNVTLTGANVTATSLGVAGATTLSSTLGVTGATTLSSTATVAGQLTTNGNLLLQSGMTTTNANTVINLDATNSSATKIKMGSDLYGSDTGINIGMISGGAMGIRAGGSLSLYCGATRAAASGGIDINSSGNTNVTGALSKASGSFRISHPLPSLEATHQLVHSFIEGPQADLIYRGKVNLVDGKATINIDTAATMTEGTFVILCRDVQCFTSNETDWNHVRGSVNGNILTVDCQDPTSTALISWMVIGERQDKHMMETEWTDNNGKVIVEPLKPPVKTLEQK